jgi:tetratricopeptide (TPR) repeat protein
MLLALYVLAILTKQTFVMLPVVLAWYEIGARNIGLGAAVAYVTPSWRTAIIAAAAALVGFEILVRYALPLSRTATIPPATFVLSQIANAPVIARFYLLPYQTTLIHDLYLYRGLAHVDVWTGLALISAIAFVAYRWRARPAAWLLGALLICLVPTNSVLPKNEIVREWRLYTGLVFYALLVGQVFSSVSGWLRARVRARTLRFAPHAAVVVYLAAFARSDVLQNRVYQTGVGAWQQVLERYPYSADAMNNIGLYYFYQGQPAEAATYFQMAADAGPETSLYRYNLAQAYWALGDGETAERHSAAAAELRARHGMRRMTLHYR